MKELIRDELYLLNQKIKDFNAGFDKLNDLYYDKSYFNDRELKQLFSSISRRAHKFENTSHKYLFVNEASSQTSDHIKEGLAKFSQDTVSKKITAPN